MRVLPSVKPSTHPQAQLSFWRIVISSLRGQNHDYATVPLKHAVVLLAVPMILEMIMESLFAVINVFWISQLGKESIAIIGLTESVMTLIYSIAMGLSIATAAIVARRIGANDSKGASHIAGQVIVLGVAVSAAMGVALSFSSENILRLMGAEESLVATGGSFIRIMLGCNITAFLIFLINGIFRGAGNAVLAMRTLWLANALNIALGPCLIFGWGPFPEMGITGAALATNIGRGVGVLYQLWHLTNGHGRVRLRLRHLKFVLADVSVIVSTASNGIAQLLISSTSWIGLFKILSLFGSSAVAAYTIAIRIVMFALMPAWGLASAGATLVGQNLGAGKPARAEEAIRIAARYNLIFLGIVSVFFILFAQPIIRLFISDPGVLDYGVRALRIISLALPLNAIGMCFSAAFNGAGDTWTSTRLNFFCCWLGQIPLAWALAQILELGAVGVFIAVPATFSVLALWSGGLFARGRWKYHRI